MHIKQRKPTMAESLGVLLAYGVQVGSVLDVGVLTGTAPLIKVFEKVPHHLFEPVNLHFKQIKKNYRKLQFTLHHVALSDKDGVAYLACRSVHRNGRVTHANVYPQPVDSGDVKGFVSCEEIPQARLDTLMATQSTPGPYLLKVDVDGHEMEVLAGATDTLSQCNVVVIEAPLSRGNIPDFFIRANFLMEHGFYLMDIVDLAYYGGVLWQVDLVFVRRDVVAARDELRPFQAQGFQFDAQKWYPLSDRLFRS